MKVWELWTALAGLEQNADVVLHMHAAPEGFPVPGPGGMTVLAEICIFVEQDIIDTSDGSGMKRVAIIEGWARSPKPDERVMRLVKGKEWPPAPEEM